MEEIIPLFLTEGIFGLLPPIDVQVYSARPIGLCMCGKSSACNATRSNVDLIGEIAKGVLSLLCFITPYIKTYTVVDEIHHGQSTASRRFAAAHPDSGIRLPRANYLCGQGTKDYPQGKVYSLRMKCGSPIDKSS